METSPPSPCSAAAAGRGASPAVDLSATARLATVAPEAVGVDGAECPPALSEGMTVAVVEAAVEWAREMVVPQATEAAIRRPAAAMAARSARWAVGSAVVPAAAAAASATMLVDRKGDLEEVEVADGVVCHQVAAWEERRAEAVEVGFWVAVVASVGARVGAKEAVVRATAAVRL